jgi:hypothetical protein
MKKHPSTPPPGHAAGRGTRGPVGGPASVDDERCGRADTGRTQGRETTGIDPASEQVVPLSHVPKLGLIPARRNGARLNVRPVYRWATTGLRGVRLESLMIGGQRVTSCEALTRFFAAVSARPTRPTDTAGKLLRASPQAIDDECDREGL